MVMCNRQEWLVDLVRGPGMLLPLRPDTVPQAPYLTLLTGHPSGQQPLTPPPPAPDSPLKSSFQAQMVHWLTVAHYVSTTSSPPSLPVTERQACVSIAYTSPS